MEEFRRCRLKRKIFMAFGMGLAIAGVLCMVGLVVSLILLGMRDDSLILYASLCGGFAGGTAVFGLSGLGCMHAGEQFLRREYDAYERADSEESFLVGEETLARFGVQSFTVINGKKKIEIPYSETKFYSVCTRRAPREKGEWSVLFEFPARFLDPKNKKDEPPVLVQTDGKERLYRCLSAHGLSLLGELPADGKTHKKTHKKFVRIQKFNVPLIEKRKRALLLMIVGAVAFCGGVGLAFYSATFGAIVAVLGGYALFHGTLSLRKAKRTFSVYEEGLFLGEPNSRESCFLKWEEIDRLRSAEGEKGSIIRIECPYGAYEFPRPDGAYEFLKQRFPDKCGE